MTKNQKIKRLEKAHRLLKEICDGSPEQSLIDAEYPTWFDNLTIAMGSILDAKYNLKDSDINAN